MGVWTAALVVRRLSRTTCRLVIGRIYHATRAAAVMCLSTQHAELSRVQTADAEAGATPACPLGCLLPLVAWWRGVGSPQRYPPLPSPARTLPCPSPPSRHAGTSSSTSADPSPGALSPPRPPSPGTWSRRISGRHQTERRPPAGQCHVADHSGAVPAHRAAGSGWTPGLHSATGRQQRPASRALARGRTLSTLAAPSRRSVPRASSPPPHRGPTRRSSCTCCWGGRGFAAAAVPPACPQDSCARHPDQGS